MWRRNGPWRGIRVNAMTVEAKKGEKGGLQRLPSAEGDEGQRGCDSAGRACGDCRRPGGDGPIASTGTRIGSCGGSGTLLYLVEGGFRRLALRHERLLATFQGFMHLACFLITWRGLTGNGATSWAPTPARAMAPA